MTITRVKPKKVCLMRGVVLITLLLASPLIQASGLNLHWLWHNSCAECHGHSADFSRRFLTHENGQLMGLHHRTSLKLFLKNHYLAAKEVDAMYEMLLAQNSTAPRFQHECSRCHANAVEFVSNSLRLRNGALFGHKSGLSVKRYLQNHQQLKSDDIAFYLQQLTRIAHETYRP